MQGEKKVTVVYFAFINDGVQWMDIISMQLIQLKNTGIGEISDIYIHISGSQNNLTSATSNVKSILPGAIVSTSTDNQFEYPGIHLAWRLARENPERIYLYFHSKGMCSGEIGLTQQKKLFQTTIESWRKVMNIFENNDHVNKVGFAPSEAGWMWFNFWWARGAYLAKCEEPELTMQRYYYEEWLYHRSSESSPSNTMECYALCDDRTGSCYSPAEACAKMDEVKLTI